MLVDANPQTFPCTEELLRDLGDKEFRHSYLDEHVRTGIAFQIHGLRNQRRWTQKDLADKAGKPANSISRLEDPEYGKASLTTLLEVAQAFDVALLVQFVEWDDFLIRTADVSPSALQKRSFDLSRLLALQQRQHPVIQEAPDKRQDDGLGNKTSVSLVKYKEWVALRGIVELGIGDVARSERKVQGFGAGLGGAQGEQHYRFAL